MKITGGGMAPANIEDLDEYDIVNLVDALKDSAAKNAQRAEGYRYSKDERYKDNEHLRWEDIAFAYSQAAAMARMVHEMMWEYDHERSSMGWATSSTSRT
jgi:hypothetical protein